MPHSSQVDVALENASAEVTLGAAAAALEAHRGGWFESGHRSVDCKLERGISASSRGPYLQGQVLILGLGSRGLLIGRGRGFRATRLG